MKLPAQNSKQLIQRMFGKILAVWAREGFVGCFRLSKIWLHAYYKELASLKDKPPESSFGCQSPLVSILIPCWRSEISWISNAIGSVAQQKYINWELCVSSAELSFDVLSYLQNAQSSDARIKWLNSEEAIGISENLNRAATLASGKYITFLDHDDILFPDAIGAMVDALEDSGAFIAYSDEQRMTSMLHRLYLSTRKPDWAPHTFLSWNYFCHLTMIRKSLFEEVGGFRQVTDGAQDWDLFFRCVEKVGAPEHVRKVLYGWRAHRGSIATGNIQIKKYAAEAQVNAVRGHLARTGRTADVVFDPDKGVVDVKYEIGAGKKIEIVCSPRSRQALREAIQRRNPLAMNVVEAECGDWGKVVTHTQADLLLFLGPGVLCIQDESLERLVGIAWQSDVCAAGGLITDTSRRIVVAQYHLSTRNQLISTYHGYPASARGYLHGLIAIQDVTAVSPYFCAMVPVVARKIFSGSQVQPDPVLIFKCSLEANIERRWVVFDPAVRVTIQKLSKRESGRIYPVRLSGLSLPQALQERFVGVM